MTYKIYETHELSFKAREKIKNAIQKSEPFENDRNKYPFDDLEIGQGFRVRFGDASENTLRVSAHAKNKRSGKEFVVIKLSIHAYFEIVRIA